MGRPSKYNIDKDKLIDLYINQNLSTMLVAEKLRISPDVIRYFLEKHRIYKSVEQRKCQITKSSSSTKLLSLSKQDLEKLVNEDQKSYAEIAEMCDTTASTVANRFHKLNCKRLSFDEIMDKERDYIYDLYILQNKRLDEVAKLTNHSPELIKRSLDRWKFYKTEEQKLLLKNSMKSSLSESQRRNYLKSLPDKEYVERLFNDCNKNITRSAKLANVSIETFRKWLINLDIYKPVKKEPLSKLTIQAYLNAGKFISEIAELTNYSEPTVSKFISDNGIIRSEEGKEVVTFRKSSISRNYNLNASGGRQATEEELFHYIIDLNMSYEQIAKILGVGSSVVGVWAKKFGIARTEEQKQAMIQDYVKRGKETTLNRYGVFPYGLKDYDSESVEIIQDKSKFLNYLESIPEKNRTWAYVASKLGMPIYLIHNYYKKYDFDIKMSITLCSTIEEMVREHLDDWKIDYERNNRVLIKPKELDFYIPSKNIALELNGNWSHSTTSYGKYTPIDKNYHLNKLTKCSEIGVRLIHIYEYELYNHSNAIFYYLQNALNHNMIRIYARKCSIVEVDKITERQFLNEYHVQGYVSSKVCYGLEYENDLVAIMSFGRPRFKSNVEWELERFVVKGEHNVIGGASKLFTYFIRTNSPNSIISYCNRDKFLGSIYNMLGFKLDHISPPNYVWVRDNVVYSRYQCQKHKLSKILGDSYDSKISESDNMIKAHYNKLYDCGNLVYMWKK